MCWLCAACLGGAVHCHLRVEQLVHLGEAAVLLVDDAVVDDVCLGFAISVVGHFGRSVLPAVLAAAR